MRALTKKHLVQEQRHDLLLGKLLFNLEGEKRLFEFSAYRLFAREEVIACELLRQCTATAARGVTGSCHAQDRPEDAAVIDA